MIDIKVQCYDCDAVETLTIHDPKAFDWADVAGETIQAECIACKDTKILEERER